MFLVPAVGVPSELMLQDTLKSALVAFGVLAAALLFFWQQRHRTGPLLWHGLVWLPLALMAYALGSMVWSHTYLAGVEAIRWFLLSLLLWLGLNTLNRENLPTLLWGIHGGVVVASLWVVLQFWLDLRWFPQFAQPASTFANRNFFAEYAVSVLPLSVWLLASARPSRWLGLMALSIAISIIAVLMTGTRSALIAMLLVVPVLLFALVNYRQQLGWSQWNKTHITVVAATMVLGVAVLGVIPSGNPTIAAGSTPLSIGLSRSASVTQVGEFTHGSFSVRSIMWKATARMVMDKPLTGVGAGAWEVHIPLYQGRNNSLETDFYAHNEYLQLLGEYGAIVGGLILATLFSYLILSAVKTLRLRGPDMREGPWRAFVLTSMLTLLIVSNAGFPWHLAACGALLALNLGLLACSDTRLQMKGDFWGRTAQWRPICSVSAFVLLLSATVLATLITYLAAEAERKIVTAIHLTYIDAGTVGTSDAALAPRRAAVLKNLHDGIAINPHYRKITALAADRLAAGGNWTDALWVLESIATSRPYIPSIWANIVLMNLELGRGEQAHMAYQHLFSLQPDAPRTRALDIVVLRNRGQEVQAAEKLRTYFKHGVYEYDLLQQGYAIGYALKDWPLAIQSLEVRNQLWPEQAADGYMRLGKIYDETDLKNPAMALESFKKGLAAAPPVQRNNVRKQIPLKYQVLLTLSGN